MRSFLDGQNLLHGTKSDSDGSNSLQVSEKLKFFVNVSKELILSSCQMYCKIFAGNYKN